MRRRSQDPSRRDHPATPGETVPETRVGPRGLSFLQSAAGNAAVAGLLGRRAPVQRNVGIELEESTWGVEHSGTGGKVDKAVPIVHRPMFQMQAEYNGEQSAIELVTNPPGAVDRAEWSTMVAGMKALGEELKDRPRYARFPASHLSGGVPGYRLTAGYRYSPTPQITAGVPLAAIPVLLAKLNALGSGFTVTVPGAAAVNQIVADFRGTTRTSPVHQPGAADPTAEHGELIGFVTMIKAYLSDIEGTAGADLDFLKRIPKVMARTDFAAMFMMLDQHDQQAIAANQKEWIEALTADLAARGGQEPLVPNTVHDPNNPAPARRLGTTREDWLTGMMSEQTRDGRQPGRDLLSAKGRLDGPDPIATRASPDVVEARKLGADLTEPAADGRDHRAVADQVEAAKDDAAEIERILAELKEFFLGLGSLGGTTDTVEYADGGRSDAVIVELRKPKGDQDWAAAEAVYTAVEETITEDGRRPGTSVMTPKGQALRDRADQDRREAEEANPRTLIRKLVSGSQLALSKTVRWVRIKTGQRRV